MKVRQHFRFGKRAWRELSPAVRRSYVIKYEMEKKSMNCFDDEDDCPECGPVNTVACTPASQGKIAVPPYGLIPNKTKKDTNMYHANATLVQVAGRNENDEKREYLRERLYEVTDDMIDKLRKDFGLNDNDPPKNGAELIKVIQAGQYVLDEKAIAERTRYYDSPLYGISFRDPNQKKDHEGFEAATQRLRDAEQKVRDVIAIAEPADALKALQDFEATDFSTETATVH